MPSFYIPLSGLNADSTALNTIANNLSNMNTTAFKSEPPNSPTCSISRSVPQVWATIQVGGGVRVAANNPTSPGNL